MCQLLETIKVQDNQLRNISFHSERVNNSRRKLFGSSEEWDLRDIINISETDSSVIYRCRFLYSIQVNKIEFIPYTPRIIKRLRIVFVDNLDYTYKYANRKVLDDLKLLYCKNSDEEILIIKNGLVTDTSFSNIAFFDGNMWTTPDSPLLAGTKRAFYLKNKILKEQKISFTDIQKYRKIRLINAMLDLETSVDIDISDVL